MEIAALPFPLYGSLTAFVLVMGAWLAAQALHDRRLRSFGNPRLLGMTGLWPRRICSAFLLAMPACVLVPLIGDTGSGSRPRADSPGSLMLLIDPPRPSSGQVYASITSWEEYVRDLQLVVENLRPERFAIYQIGPPPKLLVPLTKDVAGSFMLLDAVSPYAGASTVEQLISSVEAVRLISMRPEAEAVSRVVVISPRTEQEIETTAGSVKGMPQVSYMRSVRGKGVFEYKQDGTHVQWFRLLPRSSSISLEPDPVRIRQRLLWPSHQVFALIAFLSLLLEWVLRLASLGGAGPTVQERSSRKTGSGRRTIASTNCGTSACLLVAVFVLAPRTAAADLPRSASAEGYHTSLQAISPHLAIVTETSNQRPYVGEQFSVVYKLRCSSPPAAVDVDPQDFMGFWMVSAPAAGQARTEAVTLNGRSATDFLLRQVILFPLRAGKHSLPPLRLKLKHDGRSREDWDLIASADPMEIDVQPVPAAANDQGNFSLVGDLKGEISSGRSGEASEATLEVEGTVNLDLFKPEGWLKCRDGQPVSVRLAGRESLIQTRDFEGKRRLTLLLRQRWHIRTSSGERVALRLERLRVPFFDPRSSHWRSLEISPGAPAPEARLPQAASSAHLVDDPSWRPPYRLAGLSAPAAIGFVASCLAFLFVLLAGSGKRNRIRVNT